MRTGAAGNCGAADDVTGERDDELEDFLRAIPLLWPKFIKHLTVVEPMFDNEIGRCIEDDRSFRSADGGACWR